MKRLDSMDFDELLALQAKVEAAITARIAKERKRLTDSLDRLDSIQPGAGARKTRGQARGQTRGKRAVRGEAKARKLVAKFRNPENAEEIWAGRGSRPRWLTAALKGGRKKLEDFAV